MSVVGLRRRLERLIDTSPLLAALNYGKGQVASRLGLRRHRSGATLDRVGLERGVALALSSVEDYLRYAGVPAGGLDGKRILELGPGDSVGVALCLLARGASSVVAVDAFDPRLDRRREVGLYRALLDSFSPVERARAERGLRLLDDREVELVPERLRLLRRISIVEAPRALAGERFDVVLSRAVLEHVPDLERSWASMLSLLAPGGAMWHKVDLRHHGLFAAIHPLHFLTVGERVWRWVSSPDPTLNRLRAGSYHALAAATFRRVRMLVTHVLDREELVPHLERLRRGIDYGDHELALVRDIRPRLQPRFRELGDEDLLISGVFLIAEDAGSRP